MLNKLLPFLCIIITLQACVYRIDIDQGNRINPEQLTQLKTGMSRSQVNFLLGNAAIKDQYHANQDHYVYYLHDGEKQTTELRTMILTYENNILINIEGAL